MAETCLTLLRLSDLTTFTRLDERGQAVIEQRLEPDCAVLVCRIVDPNDSERQAACLRDRVPGDSEEIGGAFGGICLVLVIDRRRRAEPLNSIVYPTGLGQGVGVGVPEPNAAWTRIRAIEAATFQHAQRCIKLAQIPSSASDDDQQLGSHCRVQTSDRRIVQCFQRTLWPA
jgi:hypothetical protein